MRFISKPLLLSILLLLCVLILTLVIESLVFQSGKELPKSDFVLQMPEYSQTGQERTANPFIERIIVFFIQLTVLASLVALFFRQFRKYAFIVILIGAVLSALIWSLTLLPRYDFSLPSEQGTAPMDISSSEQPMEERELETVELLEEIEDSSGILFPMASLLLSGFLVWLGFVFFRRISKKPEERKMKDLLGTAVQELYNGHEIQNVILRCWADLANLIWKERAVSRKSNMTAREFEQRLFAEGLPQADVHQLTTLFERVRYGNKSFTAGEIDAAKQCLQRIILCLETRND